MPDIAHYQSRIYISSIPYIAQSFNQLGGVCQEFCSVRPDGALHLRYTDRTRSILWREDPITAEAVAWLKDWLHRPGPWHFEGRLEAGWGLVSNNVLHTRTGFTDGPRPRLLYRARYYDRIQGT